MSVRYLYRVLPASKRICSYWRCGTQILRNLTRTADGRLWHYGCLQSAKDDHFQCFDCNSRLDGTEVNQVDFDEGRKFACGNCGSTNLKLPVNFRRIPPLEVVQEASS